jgi:hypothetical protein
MELTALIACIVVVTLGNVAWPWLRRIPRRTLIPLAVYLGAYVLTYCIGAVAVAATEGGILEFFWDMAVHIPADILRSPEYWVLLLMPLLVVPLTVLLLHRRGDEAAERGPREARPIGVLLPLVLYTVSIAYILQNPTYWAAWRAPFDYFESDASALYTHRADLLAAMSTVDSAVVYTIAPFLTFVVIQEALRSGRAAHVSLAAVMTAGTVALQLALALSAPTMIFTVTVLVAVGIRRFGRVLLPGGALTALLAARYMGVKYASRGLLIPLLDPILRMPCIYPYYLWFVRLEGHRGVQLMALLTAGRAETRTSWSTLVGSFVFPSASIAVYTPAPAHVQAFADGGLLYAFFVLVLIGVGIRAAGAIVGSGRDSTLDRAFLMSACGTIYIATQVDLLEVLWGGAGIVWSLLTYALLKLLSAPAAHPGKARLPKVAQ